MNAREGALKSGRAHLVHLSKNRKATRQVTQSDQATMAVTLYDGTREPITKGSFLIRIFDGFQNQLFDNFKPAPTTVFQLPFRNNLQANCTVLASGDGYVDAGFTPIKLSIKAFAMVDRMLLEDEAGFQFQSWSTLKTTDSVVGAFLSIGRSYADARNQSPRYLSDTAAVCCCMS